jgi:hypothetical protein
VRRFLILVPLFALLGNIAAILLAPIFIRWWFEPPVQAGAMAALNCVNAVDYGIHRFVWAQIICASLGGMVGFVLAVVFRKKKVEPAATATLPAPNDRVPAKT